MHLINKLLTPGRTVCRAPGVSKKRLFETAARIISNDQISLPYDSIFSHLIAREKLGSTGLGKGIAIPHCRIDNCTHAMSALITLEDPILFDAPDGEGVDILFVLLVPEEADQQHLDILSEIAGLFSQEDFCAALRAAKEPESLHFTATHWAL